MRENAHQGTTTWQILAGKAATIQIQAYAGAVSVAPGQRQVFYVSVQHDNTPYVARIYRLGWYGGAGARLVATSNQVGHAQGYYDPASHTLVNCLTCTVDTTTGLIEAGWQPSLTFTIPATWITGVYLATFTNDTGLVTTVPFDVRGSPRSTYLAITSDTTVAAYNQWGGYSLYRGPDDILQSRAVEVSFDRPAAGLATMQGLAYEIDAIRWLERNGYDISYASSVDLDEYPGQLLNHRAYLSLGHDEYWSKAMRDGVELARDAGVGLAFLGANAAYWQIRFAPDAEGRPNRAIICYKDAKADPLYGIDNSRVTDKWRDYPISRPENSLIGIMYAGNVSPLEGFPWRAAAPSSPLMSAVGLVPGKLYGCDLVGYEWDAVADNGKTPAGLVVIGESPTSGGMVAATAYYIADSGAFVFASGSIQWTYGLDNMRLLPVSSCQGKDGAVPAVQGIMAYVMSALIVRHIQGSEG